MKKELGIQKDDFIITMVARLDPVKCHTLALAALKEVVREYPFVKLLLIGDGPIREDLENKVKEYQLERKVLFLGYQNDVSRYYQLADVTLLTSKTESFPLVLLESARECTPVITTDVGGVKKMIPDETYGYIVDNNMKAIVFALKKIIKLERNNQLNIMGKRFYEYTSQRFSVQSFANSISIVYQKLIKK